MSTGTRSLRALVLVSDDVTALVRKGEVTRRYYNPADLFGEVHLLLTHPQSLNPADVRVMAGDARLEVHPHPEPSFKESLGWTNSRFRKWVRDGIEIGRRARPDVIRAYGGHLNAHLAVEVGSALNVPVVVSMHNNPDTDDANFHYTLRDRIVSFRMGRLRAESLRRADRVIAVYKGILPYLYRIGVNTGVVAYNAVNPDTLKVKTSYESKGPLRILSVGRLIEDKNPEQLIRSMLLIKDASLTVVGDGVIRPRLASLVEELELSSRVTFIPAMANDELCRRLHEFDVFAVHSNYLGLPKTVIEALLAGLPVVTNSRPGEPVEEYLDAGVELTENTPEGYAKVLRKLIDSPACREALGVKGRVYAWANFAPEMSERRFREIYEDLIGRRR